MNNDAPPVQHEFAYMCQSALRPALCMVFLPTLGACTRRETLPEDELFRRIQVHEAAIADAEHRVRRANVCREAHEQTERGVCDESKALCDLAQGAAQQVDATQRCLIASDTCRAMREQARALCAAAPTDDGSRARGRASTNDSRARGPASAR